MSHKSRPVEVVVRERSSDTEALLRLVERWKKRYEETRDRAAYLEGALIGIGRIRALEAEVETILAGGPGKRQVGR